MQETSAAIESALAVAIAARDADGLELALNDLFRSGLPAALAPLLATVLVMDWHTRHEDVADALQSLKDPRTVDALFSTATARHAYLNYDEFFGLARKCIWALADVGTPAARQRLRELEANENPTIAGYARKRLENWEAERQRKQPAGTA